MVMKSKIMRRNLRQSILKSITRYIAIVAIIALGAGIFVGLRTTKSDMVATGQRFMDGQNMFDLRLLNPYGWSDRELDAVRQMDGVADAEGTVSLDVLGHMSGAENESVYKLHSIPETVNQVYLLGGRMPERPDECLMDGDQATDAVLGKTFTVSDTNEAGTLDSLSGRTFTVVGYVSTPLYMDPSRGNTTLGNGVVAAYLYLPRESFQTDYYTEIYITIPGDHTVYTGGFHDAMDAAAEALKPQLLPLAKSRYETLLADGEKAYADGQQKYLDGCVEYERGKSEAENELREAEAKLLDGQREIDHNREVLEQSALEIRDGLALLDENALLLLDGRRQLAEAKAAAFSQLADANAQLVENYKTVNENLKLVNDGLRQIDSGLMQLDSGISQLESGLEQMKLMVSLLETMIGVADTGLNAAQTALDQAKEMGADADTIARLEENLQAVKDRLETHRAQYDELQTQQETYTRQLADLKVQREELASQREELDASRVKLENAMADIDAGFVELQNSRTQAEDRFAAEEAKLAAGEAQVEKSRQELNAAQEKIDSGREELKNAEAELAQGRQAYEDGRKAAEEELRSGWDQLSQAEEALADARRELDNMKAPDVYALTRTTNVGYLALESNSDIVKGVSAVFPAFFLLIAALVCITTMTRMVEEERTQIGTLKALGYTNGEIISKYLYYAGSAALLGCGLGVTAGSVVFPTILWKAYSIILTVTPGLVLRIDWALCAVVVVVYTAVCLGVTWYSCRVSLREVPAELIRPKPMATGKKLLLEYLPFWKKISFLNKVMLRNIFRYRQRLLMMLVGIGGCTALLLTGFGVRDSIADIASYQFDEITLYDMNVRFSGDMGEEAQNKFREETAEFASGVCFYHQSSAELDHDGATRDIYLLAADSGIETFMDFHSGKRDIPMPGPGEALISVGIAGDMGIHVGDTVTLRSGDMQLLKLRISGIYDNYVYNYIITTPETVAAQWGQTPEVQMACVTVRDRTQAYEAGRQIMGMDGVTNVVVSQAMAEQVGSMMDALDLVVLIVVICAALLAVTVLYNLTNINITERIREIATLKVLGFNSRESAAYVFKENLLLSVMGSLLGLLGGYGLLAFVMSQIKVNMVWFVPKLSPWSYVLAIVLTLLLACIVDFILYFRLEKINMAEALKSVE